MKLTSALVTAILMMAPTSALAADISVPEPSYDWTGFYGGVFGSYSFGTAHGETITKCGPCSDSFDIDGMQAGALAGYNFQSGRILYGAESDIGFRDIDGVGFHGTIDDFDVSPLTHVRARIGLPMDRVLPFIAAGLTIGDGDARIAGQGVPSHLHFGWNVGAGLEYGLNDHVSVRAEYLYDDLSSQTYDFPGSSIDFNWSSSTARAAAIIRF